MLEKEIEGMVHWHMHDFPVPSVVTPPKPNALALSSNYNPHALGGQIVRCLAALLTLEPR